MEWDLCQSVFSEYDEDGFLLISHDAHGEKTSGVHPGEAHWQGGTWYRPRDPDTDSDGNPKKGCTVWQVWEGNQNHIKVASDPRAVPKLPRAKKGGSGYYGDTGKGQLPYIAFDGEDGSFTLYVPYDFSGEPPNDSPNKAMAISVDVSTAGEERIQIIHGGGASASLLADGSVVLVPSDKGASISALVGGKIVLNGNTSIQGAVLMGNPSAAFPVALATQLQAYLTGLETAISAALLAVGVGPAANGGTAKAAFDASSAALAAAKTAIAALLTKAA